MKSKEVKNTDRIIRTYDNTIIGGVCGAISDHFGISPYFVRTLWFISIFCYGFGIAMYILLWILLPSDRIKSYL
jgi:phage shock protein PspC (stress-responsive transcriptional regulator)